MQFQRSTDYAIRILHYLHHSKTLGTAPIISAAIGTSYPNFTKIATQLKKHGLLTSEQGRHGGYRLAKPADTILIYDVFLAVEGEMVISHCLEDRKHKGGGAPHCVIQEYFQQVQDILIECLSSQSIADLDTVT